MVIGRGGRKGREVGKKGRNDLKVPLQITNLFQGPFLVMVVVVVAALVMSVNDIGSICDGGK